MDKLEILNKIVESLESQLVNLKKASLDAASHATNEESKADSKWDTQGIEASYLARGHADQAEAMMGEIKLMKNLIADLPDNNETVQMGILVKCDLSGFEDYYFLAPSGGGLTLKIESNEVTVITARSPIAKQLMRKSAGVEFLLPNGNKGKILNLS